MLTTKTLFDEGWLFHEGEIDVPASPHKSTSYIQAKKERRRTGPAARIWLDAPEYYEERGALSHEVWKRVTLPHDYTIKQEPKEENNECLGFFQYENAWYRKHFDVPQLADGSRVRMYFEGVASRCEVFVNGCYMRSNKCGYTSFEVDVTDVVDFGAENVVAVHVLTDEHDGWWYDGAGIYRHAWLEIADACGFARDGIFVHPEKAEDGTWRMTVDAEIVNAGFAAAECELRLCAKAADGSVLAELRSEPLELADGGTKNIRLCAEGLRPLIWDVDSPNLYTLSVELLRGGETVEQTEVRFGFREFRFDAEHGFFLNGRRVEINGVCCHLDFGLTGKAVPEVIQTYRVALMKEMGANAWRCAHYPHTAATMDALDEQGMLCMAETRWFDSTPEGMEQLEMLIRRDRNHPCVILWSAGNEEPFHRTEAGRRTAMTMMRRIRQLDGTRPVTTAVSNDPLHCAVLREVDVIGVNYNLEQIDAIRALYPDKPIVSSECCAAATSRGWYDDDAPLRGYARAYDHDINKTFRSREITWKFVTEREWLAGGFQWAGIEHRGEAAWPRVCSQSGAVDLFLQKKDAFYQNRAFWRSDPVAHILPHWNRQGREGEYTRVWVYTNCDTAELFLNGESLGIREVGHCGHAEWNVPYVPGELRAVCVRGAETAEDTVRTTGAAESLRLRVLTQGGGYAFAVCECLDANGLVVPDAAPFVRFDTDANGIVAGTGSDVSDHVPVPSPDRRMRAGVAAVLVRQTGDKCVLRAQADGLRCAKLTLEGK